MGCSSEMAGCRSQLRHYLPAARGKTQSAKTLPCRRQRILGICVRRKERRRQSRHSYMMAQFLYRCPNTGQLVQGWSAEEMPEGDDSYDSVTCLACAQLHFVNRTSGRVLGADTDE